MERLTSSTLDQILAQVAPAIAGGSVNMISVEAIRARSGDRWARKRDQVENFVERAFSRLATPGDLIVGLNDAEFVTIQPNTSRSAALSRSANLLKETLAFFLGAAGREDMRLFRVCSFVNGELGVEAVDAGRVLAGDDDPPPAPERMIGEAEAPPADIVPAGALSRARLVNTAGGELEVRIVGTQIWNIRGRAVTSFRLQADLTLLPEDGPPRTPRPGEVSALLAGEATLRVLEHAEQRLVSGVSAGLHVPVPLSAVSYSTSRYRLLRALQALAPGVRRFLMLELVDLQAGLPQSRLSELAAMLNPFCRAVLARAPSPYIDLKGWRRCGLGGVTLDCAGMEADDRQAALRLSAFAATAELAAPACIAYGVRSRAVMLAAWGAGFTHVSGPAVTAPPGDALQGVRLAPEDIYTNSPFPARYA